jgi:hypothetical protein
MGCITVWPIVTYRPLSVPHTQQCELQNSRMVTERCYCRWYMVCASVLFPSSCSEHVFRQRPRARAAPVTTTVMRIFVFSSPREPAHVQGQWSVVPFWPVREIADSAEWEGQTVWLDNDTVWLQQRQTEVVTSSVLICVIYPLTFWHRNFLLDFGTPCM